MTSKEQTKFRTSIKWKLFRQLMIEKAQCRCSCCGVHRSKGRGFNLHHLFPSDYELLIEENFAILCGNCHSAVELLYKRLKAKKCTVINKDKWLALYGPFLPKYSLDII